MQLRALEDLIVPSCGHPLEVAVCPSLTLQQAREWGVLDTFDALSAYFDHPQSPEAVRGWYEEAGLEDIQVRRGGNGVVASGRKA